MKDMITLITVSVMLLAVPALAEGASAPKNELVRVERISELSAREFWALGEAKTIHSGGLPVLGYWPFDPDEIQEVDGWRRIGIIGAGLTDVGETPVLARVWAIEGVSFLEQDSQEKSRGRITQATAVFGSLSVDCDGAECKGVQVEFSVKDDGSVFFDDGKFGQIE